MNDKSTILTVSDVKREVARIARVYENDGDDEGCHSDEDNLHITVLGLIADGATRPTTAKQQPRNNHDHQHT